MQAVINGGYSTTALSVERLRRKNLGHLVNRQWQLFFIAQKKDSAIESTLS